jgi:hypothetical protein
VPTTSYAAPPSSGLKAAASPGATSVNITASATGARVSNLSERLESAREARGTTLPRRVLGQGFFFHSRASPVATPDSVESLPPRSGKKSNSSPRNNSSGWIGEREGRVKLNQCDAKPKACHGHVTLPHAPAPPCPALDRPTPDVDAKQPCNRISACAKQLQRFGWVGENSCSRPLQPL